MHKKSSNSTRVLSEVAFAREMGLLNFYDRVARRRQLHSKMKKCIYNSLFTENYILNKMQTKNEKSPTQLAEDVISGSG